MMDEIISYCRENWHFVAVCVLAFYFQCRVAWLRGCQQQADVDKANLQNHLNHCRENYVPRNAVPPLPEDPKVRIVQEFRKGVQEFSDSFDEMDAALLKVYMDGMMRVMEKNGVESKPLNTTVMPLDKIGD